MKKLVLVLAVAFSGVLNAQQDSVITQGLLNSINEMFEELNFRRELGGYVPDTTGKFEPVLIKLIEGRLDVDSLESKQRALYRIGVNEDFIEGHKHINVLTYFHNFDIEKFKDTTKFTFKYYQAESGEGNRYESFVIHDKETRKQVLYVTLQFETYSNLIRGIWVEQ